MTNLDNHTIKTIEMLYLRNQLPWALGFSGGKDSTAMLKLVYNALMNIKKPKKEIYLVYCNSGVEIPLIENYVKNTLKNLTNELRDSKLPIKVKIVEPKIENRFFSKVIGRGYPTPTNKFRWCTDRLRIHPVQHIMNDTNNIVLVGIRKGESKERDKILENNYTNEAYILNQSNYSKVKIFAPILNYNVGDIWSVLKSKELPKAIDGTELELIYKYASNSFEVRKDIEKQIDNHGRFGCWTCTVVRKDKSTQNLINNGFTSLLPLLEFRDWLYYIRDKDEYRCHWRRNGQRGKGPFTLDARKLILDKLLLAQEKSKYNLISEQEISFILSLWELDKTSAEYRE